MAMIVRRKAARCGIKNGLSGFETPKQVVSAKMKAEDADPEPPTFHFWRTSRSTRQLPKARFTFRGSRRSSQAHVIRCSITRTALIAVSMREQSDGHMKWETMSRGPVIDGSHGAAA